MADRLRLHITTPEKVILEADVEKVNLTTQSGEITVLPNHEAMISVLKPGELRITEAGVEKPLIVGRGYLEVQAGRLTVLAETAERLEEIDEQRAEEARRKAEKLMAEKLDEESFAEATALLERSLARLKIARKYRHRGHHGSGKSILKE